MIVQNLRYDSEKSQVGLYRLKQVGKEVAEGWPVGWPKGTYLKVLVA